MIIAAKVVIGRRAAAAALVFLSGCSHQASQPAPQPPNGADKNWFCDAGQRDSRWNCVESSAELKAPNTTQVRTSAQIPQAITGANAAPKSNAAAPAQSGAGDEAAGESPIVHGDTLHATVPGATDTPSGNASDVNAAHAKTDEPGAPAQPHIRILEQPPNAWVIQLIATTSRENLEAIAAKYKLFAHPAVRLAAAAKIHYVLLWDVYPDKASASAALQTLPKALRDMHPWVRKVDTLQAAMMAATKISPPPAPQENP